MHHSSIRRLTFQLLKWGVSLSIIGWLVYQACQDKSFAKLAEGPKDWGLLSGALLLCLIGVALANIRWYVLVRALDMPFTMRDAFRLGFLGYLLNFVSLGGVGGDLFKAVFVAREQHGRRAEAVATVLLDRIVGLYSLFVVATTAILLTGFTTLAVGPEVQWICRATVVCTAIGTVGIALFLSPLFNRAILLDRLGSLPKIGPTLKQLLWAMRMYRSKWSVLLLSTIISFGIHSLFCTAFYLIARGLLPAAPPLATHFVIIPLAMITGVLPLPVNGLGAFEGVVAFLYAHCGAATVLQQSEGLLVSLAYRLITVLIALFGVGVYLTSRREVSATMHEAEQEADALEDNPNLLLETSSSATR